jgi:two-component system response regulator BaeR
VEFQLLKVLAARPGRIYSRDQLMDAMYRDERVVSDRTVDSHVKKLRKKIADALPDREIIHSVYGVGYKYEW